MRQVQYCGKTGYRGVDQTTRERFRAAPGETVAVSQAKFDQLMQDFPQDWKDRGPMTIRPADRARNVVAYPVVVEHRS